MHTTDHREEHTKHGQLANTHGALSCTLTYPLRGIWVHRSIFVLTFALTPGNISVTITISAFCLSCSSFRHQWWPTCCCDHTGAGAPKRRREQRLGQSLRHERQSVAVALPDDGKGRGRRSTMPLRGATLLARWRKCWCRAGVGLSTPRWPRRSSRSSLTKVRAGLRQFPFLGAQESGGEGTMRKRGGCMRMRSGAFCKALQKGSSLTASCRGWWRCGMN